MPLKSPKGRKQEKKTTTTYRGCCDGQSTLNIHGPYKWSKLFSDSTSVNFQTVVINNVMWCHRKRLCIG